MILILGLLCCVVLFDGLGLDLIDGVFCGLLGECFVFLFVWGLGEFGGWWFVIFVLFACR